MRKICALCGRETDILIEGLCPDCYRRTHPLASVKREIVGIVRCPSCGAILYKGRWVKDPKIIEKLILESIEYQGKVTSVSIESLGLRHGLNNATVKIRGSVHELINDYDEYVQVKIRYSEELCPRCRDMINEKEKAIIQVRSVIPMDGQLKRIIIDIVRKETIKDERSGFLKIEDAWEGLDIKLSDQGLARSIAYKIHKTIPSRVIESQSVVRGRGDKVITKLSISVVLVPLNRGSIIMYSNKPYYVLAYSQNTIKLMELASKEIVNIKLNDIIKSEISIPNYETKCIENKNSKNLEITIDNDKYVLSGMC
ncbi:putative nonsense mRNA decay protein [Vulcanisaeta moutnovskia 768-28]|uniref:Nonsense mRNA decay protein n=1 Tax=Vulcanisaeta moutnovskia (strain 768-28) TaxID=985053 RepID=F0QVI8_VULM7|nr:60S ribosomal export protein NMD3 [Vulcanisaeta moutnovskia]ADY00841.1 putative nonsense mRNA decay protein [Vulcanisaeta moutnovskia 768-28]